MLTLRCPHCGTSHSDDWECLVAGRPEFLRCENSRCLMSFVYAIRECAACGNESVFTWDAMPGAARLAELVCQHCAEPFNEAAGEAEGANPTQ